MEPLATLFAMSFPAATLVPLPAEPATGRLARSIAVASLA